MHFNTKMIYTLAGLLLIISCKNEEKKQINTVQEPVKISKPRVKIPRVNADSVYSFVKKQVDFGPRTPGSKAHDIAKNWFKLKFENYGAHVIMQDFDATFYTGEVDKSTNIIAQFNPEIKDRIILSAHWDTRLTGDQDKNPINHKLPIDGADDGASGVAVLLEIARTIKNNPIDLGVDIILWDAEDNGSSGAGSTNSWCLGSQYWSKNKHKSDYNADFGILLDMVGGKGATFYREGTSTQYALPLVNKIWGLAGKMGAGDLFKNEKGFQITDDHYFVNTIARIPMVDIIHTINEQEYFQKKKTHSFADHWHTHDDNMGAIDKEVLRKTTQVVTAVAYKTSDNSL